VLYNLNILFSFVTFSCKWSSVPAKSTCSSVNSIVFIYICYLPGVYLLDLLVSILLRLC
jgi:hypothetical protein